MKAEIPTFVFDMLKHFVDPHEWIFLVFLAGMWSSLLVFLDALDVLPESYKS